MRYGVIDIGSNTIRGVVYSVFENKMKKIEDKLVRSHIMAETKDKVLSHAGINRLVAIISKLKYVLRSAGAGNIFCFATSSLRGVENVDEILESVMTATGIQVEILSAGKEAEYDFLSLRANVPERNGIGIDLGGGSCQFIQFEQTRAVYSKSFDIGSNRMLLRFVSGILPTPEEREKIAFYIKNELHDVNNIFGSRYLYAMGGTAKGALRLYNKLSNTVQRDNYLSVDKLDMLAGIYDSYPEKMYDIFTKILKSRATTIIPGIVVLRTICSVLDVEGVYVLENSVREGYLAYQLRQYE